MSIYLTGIFQIVIKTDIIDDFLCNSSIWTKNIDFHSFIAEATHNSVITLTMNPMFDVLKEMNSEVKSTLPQGVEISRHSAIYHKKILQALREKNSQKVYELMLKHIFQIQEGLKNVKSRTSWDVTH